MDAAANEAEREILLRLYDKSILKQAKFRAIERLLPDTGDQAACLDIGADNGVLSYLLRRRGGAWHSADLDERVCASIRAMVGDNVHCLAQGAMPFADESFDLVVVIDAMEHLPDDRAFVAELARILRPGGRLIVNVPHDLPRSPIRRLRLAVGLNDEKHGHVRPGYTRDSLGEVLRPHFRVMQHHTYSRFFVELYDVLVSLVFERLGGSEGSSKGVVVTGDDLKRHRHKFRLFSVVYPAVWLLAQLDRLLVLSRGYSLIVSAERVAGRTAGSERMG